MNYVNYLKNRTRFHLSLEITTNPQRCQVKTVVNVLKDVNAFDITQRKKHYSIIIAIPENTTIANFCIQKV